MANLVCNAERILTTPMLLRFTPPPRTRVKRGAPMETHRNGVIARCCLPAGPVQVFNTLASVGPGLCLIAAVHTTSKDLASPPAGVLPAHVGCTFFVQLSHRAVVHCSSSLLVGCQESGARCCFSLYFLVSGVCLRWFHRRHHFGQRAPT